MSVLCFSLSGFSLISLRVEIARESAPLESCCCLIRGIAQETAPMILHLWEQPGFVIQLRDAAAEEHGVLWS